MAGYRVFDKIKINNLLLCMHLKPWISMLHMYGFQVQPRYWFRAFLITGSTLLHELLRVFNRIRSAQDVDDVIARTAIREDPVFVLGFWRTGTTHLHNLLALDERLAAPTFKQALYPDLDLVRPGYYDSLVRFFMPDTRPMDSIAIDTRSPQEEEISMLVSNNFSPMAWLVFPRAFGIWSRFFDFEGTDPSILESWKKNYVGFLKLVTHVQGKRLVLKSPANTGRIRILLDLFPDAKFVHISRHPYEVFLSNRHFYKTLGGHVRLQDIAEEELDWLILKMYRLVNSIYLRDKKQIPAGQLCEISYERLCTDPLREVESVYRRLDLGGFERLRPKIVAYLTTISGYRKNPHPRMSEEQKDRIFQNWEPFFRHWDYAR